MLAPDEVSAMVRLKSLGWGTRKIAEELGCSRTTVKRYVEAGGWVAFLVDGLRCSTSDCAAPRAEGLGWVVEAAEASGQSQ